jgi:hypothetical protein
MEKLLTDRENLQVELELEWTKFRQAIKDNKTFEELKIMYLHIKELQSQITDITNKVREKLNLRD